MVRVSGGLTKCRLGGPGAKLRSQSYKISAVGPCTKNFPTGEDDSFNEILRHVYQSTRTVKRAPHFPKGLPCSDGEL